MSETTNNPFESPKTNMNAVPDSPATGELTSLMKTYLKEASPWIRFVGIMGYIGCGLIAVIGLLMAVGFSAFGQTFASLGAMSGFMGAGVGALYIIMAVIGFFPSHFTFKLGSGIKSYNLTGMNEKLESAFKFNKSFWKFVGIIYIIYLAFLPLALIFSAVVGVIAAQ
ncbi:MAG: hypothetical protein JXB03_02880 [Spirochaetales bacterium]|nr:hypothetical protein [Spirochaetales bacterium]